MMPGAVKGPSCHHFESFNNLISEVEFYKWSLIGQWHIFLELGTQSSYALSFFTTSLTPWMGSWPPASWPQPPAAWPCPVHPQALGLPPRPARRSCWQEEACLLPTVGLWAQEEFMSGVCHSASLDTARQCLSLPWARSATHIQQVSQWGPLTHSHTGTKSVPAERLQSLRGWSYGKQRLNSP